MNDRPEPDRELGRPDPLVRRLVKSVFAPDVLEDGGRDAPLTPRGRILYWGIVSVLVIGVAVLFVATLVSK